MAVLSLLQLKKTKPFSEEKEMKKLISLFSICLLLVLKVQAQTPINEQKFDAALLQGLILKKIDSVRLAHKKTVFAPDPILQQAAVDHAAYLAKKQTLSHFQDGNKKKYNPQDRVVFFGGKGYQTGENAAEHPVKALLVKKEWSNISKVNDYEQSALLFVQQWVNSPMHFKNLMRDDYSLTGMGISYSPKNNRIYAVQVFSPQPIKQ